MATPSNQAARGNTLQIPPYSIHRLPGEKVVMSIRRSRVLYYRRLLLLALLLVLVLTVAFYGSIAPYGPISGSIAIGAGVIFLALLVWMISICIDYRYNICLLTSHRIIEIKRSPLLIREKRTETEYDNVRDVKVHVANLFERLFRIGTVDIELSTSLDIRLGRVDRPLDIQDKIYELRDQFEREEYGQYGIEQRLLQNLLAAIATQTKTGP